MRGPVALCAQPFDWRTLFEALLIVLSRGWRRTTRTGGAPTENMPTEAAGGIRPERVVIRLWLYLHNRPKSILLIDPERES